jgi:hypothetical protein
MSWHIETSDRLTADALRGLGREEFAALRIPMYCAPETAERITDLLVAHPNRTNYRARWASRDEHGLRPCEKYSETDVDRVGPADSRPEGERPSVSGVDMMRAIRATAAPHLAPIDRLRLELDEVVPDGAMLYRRDGEVSLSGVGRVMTSSKELVHADTGRRNCLTANVYLRMPATGGGTRIWRYEGGYRQSPQSYLFQPGELPDSTPNCLLKPQVCDLVIWNPALPHAVQGFEDPPRVTLQTWLLLEPAVHAADFAVRLLN